MNIFNIVKNLILTGRQTDVVDDSRNIPKTKVSYMGQVREIKNVSPYGLHSSSPKGSQYIVFSNRANDDDLVGFGTDFKGRVKNLEEGEVILMNTLTKTYALFKSNGDLEANVKGDLIVDATGDANVTASNVTITSPTALIGNCNITGNLVVSGSVTADAFIEV